MYKSRLPRKPWLFLEIEAVCAGPLAPLYYSGQFVPLIVFFLLFLAIVKNNKLHHFVRFNCMQVIIVVCSQDPSGLLLDCACFDGQTL